MSLKKLFLIFSLFLSFNSFSQLKISGTIVDIDNQPIEFANVILLNENKTEIIIGTITDEKGIFIVNTDKKGNFILQVSFIGFDIYTRSINQIEELGKIILKPNTTELNEVEIIGRKKIIERKEDKIVFNVQNTPLNKGNDGLEVLKNVPIVWVNNSDQIIIRQEPAVVLINGKKLNLYGSDLSNYIKNLNSENIQSIEIQTNASANIDGDINSGIINIVLKKKNLGLNGDVKTYYNLYNNEFYSTYNGVSLNYGSEKWNVYALYNYKTNKGGGVYDYEFILKQNRQSRLTNGSFKNNDHNHSYQLGFVTDISKNQNFGLEFYGTDNNNIANDNSNIFIKENSPIAEGKFYSEGKSNKYIYNTTLNYNIKIDSIEGNLKITADYLKHNFDDVSDNYSTYQIGNYDNNTEKNIVNSKTDIYSIQTDLHKLLFKKLKTDIGVKYIKTKRYNNLISETLTNNIFFPNDRTSKFYYDENILAGYLSVGYNLNQKNYLKAGLRLETTDFKSIDILTDTLNTRTYYNFFPSMFYSRELSNKNTISFSYSRRLRRPSFNDLNNRVNKLNDFSFDIGNPNLNPEFINKYELSFIKQNQTFSIYLNNTTDAINGIWRTENDLSIHQNINSGKSSQYGIEYSFVGKIKKWWNINTVTELFQKEYNDGIFYLHKTTFFLNLQNNFNINNTTSLSISGNFLSPFLSANYYNSESYTADIIVMKSFLKDKLNIRLYFDDVFNSIRTKNKSEFNDSYYTFFQKKNTRSFTLWLRYSFDTKNKINYKRNQTENENKDRL
jgi:outer membrane receptor protein involved in Fe transport